MPSKALPDMPGFIPKVLCDFAKEWWPKFEKDSVLREAFYRLITDQQMKTVYETLLKYEGKVKPSYQFRNAHANPENNPIIEFVWLALRLPHFANITKTISKTEYNEQLRKIATSLKKLNTAMELFSWERFANFPKDRVFGHSSITQAELSDALQDFEGFIDDASNQPPRYIPERVTTNINAHPRIWYMLRMSRLMETMFHKPLDNVVAITTNVALALPNDQVDANSVRRHRKNVALRKN